MGPADEQESTFDKIMRKYRLDDPALPMMARVLGSGIHRSLHRGMADEYDTSMLEGIGLESISQGMMIITESDMDNLDRSMVIYDAVFAYCKLQILKAEDASLAQKGLRDLSDLLRPQIKAALSTK